MGKQFKFIGKIQRGPAAKIRSVRKRVNVTVVI